MITELIFTLIYHLLIIIAVIFCGIYVYFRYSYTFWQKLDVPYIQPEFPFGNSSEAVKAKKPMGQAVISYYNEMKAKGHNYCGLYFFHNPIFMPINPELIKNIMTKDFAHFVDRGVYHDEENDPLSATLFTINGQKWKNLRAKLSPTFTSGKLKKMFETLVDCSEELKHCLNPLIEKDEPIDIKQYLVQYTTDVIGSCAFGIECNSFKNPDTDFINLGQKVFSPTGWDRFRLFLAFSIPKVAKFFKVRLTNKDVDVFYRNLVKDTIEYRERNNITRKDFMQLLIQLKNNGVIDDEHGDGDCEEKHKTTHEIGTTLTLNEATAQAFIFFVAGFETSSTTLTFCLFELAQNIHVQDKLRAEIVRVLKKHDNKITYESLNDIQYMEHVIQEALRKFPPIMVLQREATADYQLPDTNITLPKGMTVMIPVYALHSDSEYFPEPHRFDPDRFTAENKETRHDYAYLPFGEGPRNCIGLRFAMMQVKVGLTQLMLNYKFTLNSKTKLPLELDPRSFVASAKDKIWLNAERISN